jgi:hypothetical protein
MSNTVTKNQSESASEKLNKEKIGGEVNDGFETVVAFEEERHTRRQQKLISEQNK